MDERTKNMVGRSWCLHRNGFGGWCSLLCQVIHQRKSTAKNVIRFIKIKMVQWGSLHAICFSETFSCLQTWDSTINPEPLKFDLTSTHLSICLCALLFVLCGMKYLVDFHQKICTSLACMCNVKSSIITFWIYINRLSIQQRICLVFNQSVIEEFQILM